MEFEFKARIGFAREVARKCHKTLSLTIPVPIEDVLKHYGFTVMYLTDLDNSVSALADITDKVIAVNANHSITRQRFTLGHELGHYLLGHAHGAFNDVQSNRNKANSPVEQEADEFAAELLVPSQVLKKMELSNIATMAAVFNVSNEMLSIQLTKHRII
ncbi:ImmA/IrrE family metallo-endopeptidase [Paenibacillus sp. 1P03SA]|uniref:ImmA/IrrE family metallo-endopeptidase n=1 Tax=Paenibacillus sp. 1P03SA TaxID=3132294 RepID=UPI0039A35F75